MTRSGWYGLIATALWTGCLSGCLQGGLTRNTPGPDDKVKPPQPRPETLPPAGAPPGPIAQRQIDVVPPDEPPRVPVVPPVLAESPIPPLPTEQPKNVIPATPVANRVEAKPSPDPEVVAALRRLIERRPAEAKEILRHYGEHNQDSLWQVLNIAGRLHEKGLDGLTPQELWTIQDSLQRLGLIFQARAPLHISKLYFFESGRGPGETRPLGAGHVFRAADRDRPGELVQVHVEFHNLAFVEQPDKSYRTELRCSAQITDPNDHSGQPLWKADLDDGKKILYLSVPGKFATNLTFYVPPRLPTGNLALTITVEDLTHPEHPHVARRSLEFCVNNLAERTP
jgi:hypothetical protein